MAHSTINFKVIPKPNIYSNALIKAAQITYSAYYLRTPFFNNFVPEQDRVKQRYFTGTKPRLLDSALSTLYNITKNNSITKEDITHLKARLPDFFERFKDEFNSLILNQQSRTDSEDFNKNPDYAKDFSNTSTATKDKLDSKPSSASNTITKEKSETVKSLDIPSGASTISKETKKENDDNSGLSQMQVKVILENYWAHKQRMWGFGWLRWLFSSDKSYRAAFDIQNTTKMQLITVDINGVKAMKTVTAGRLRYLKAKAFVKENPNKQFAREIKKVLGM